MVLAAAENNSNVANYNEYYSNCFLEMLKRKLRHPMSIKVTYLPPKYNECYCPHFMWSDGKNDYDFGTHRYLKVCERLWFKGRINQRELGWNAKWKNYVIEKYKADKKIKAAGNIVSQVAVN